MTRAREGRGGFLPVHGLRRTGHSSAGSEPQRPDQPPGRTSVESPQLHDTGGLHACGQEWLSIESDAARILAFQPMLVPGLLQTVEYATEVIRCAEKDATQEKRDSYIEVRKVRQEIFARDNPPQYVCLLDEAVLRREVGGPAVMAAQLARILEVNNPPKLTIQVVPFGQGWHAGVHGPFNIYNYPDPMDLDVVNLDYLDGALYLEEDDSVKRYQLAFDELRATALTTRQSMELVSSVQREFAMRA